jgi:hypothetical protein
LQEVQPIFGWATWQSHLVFFKESKDDRLKTPSPPQSGTPPRRGIVEFILSHFVLILFHLFRYFQDKPSCYLAASDEDEKKLKGRMDEGVQNF